MALVNSTLNLTHCLAGNVPQIVICKLLGDSFNGIRKKIIPRSNIFFCAERTFIWNNTELLFSGVSVWLMFLCRWVSGFRYFEKCLYLLLFTQYCSGDKSRKMRWAVHVARMGEGRGLYRVLVGKPEGKRPLGRRRHRWENNINMGLQ